MKPSRRLPGAREPHRCGTRDVDLVRSLGADRVIDYTADDFCRTGEGRYDLLADIAGGRTLSDLRRVLAKGILVGVGGPDNGNWIGSGPHGRPPRGRPRAGKGRHHDMNGID